MRITQPLFQIDPGWLFLIAGLALCVPVVLIPAQRDVFHLKRQRDTLHAREQQNVAMLRTHVSFLHALDEGDPALVRRLVASQLNLVPEGHTPMLVAARTSEPIGQWIDAAAHIESPKLAQPVETTLSRLATGPRRLWLFAGGMFCVFAGLMMGGQSMRRNREVASDTSTCPNA